MRFRFLKYGFILQMAFVFTAGVAYTASVQEFSADMVMDNAGQSFQGKLYVSGGKMRLEMVQAVTITRRDKNVSWVLMPTEGMYMEQSIDPKAFASSSEDLPGQIERQSLGTEDVSGQPAEKFLIRYDQGRGEESLYQWIGRDAFPLKAAAVDGSWSMEYRNIRSGTQPESLFEIPEGYQKFEMPNAGNLAAMMQDAQSQSEN